MAKNRRGKRSRNKKESVTEDRDEFRKLNTKEEKGHLHYVCGRVGSDLQSVGITHGKRTKGINNIPLEKNPNPKDKEKAYVRPKLTQRKAKNYGKKLDGLGLSEKDKQTVWELIQRLRDEKKQ